MIVGHSFYTKKKKVLQNEWHMIWDWWMNGQWMAKWPNEWHMIGVWYENKFSKIMASRKLQANIVNEVNPQKYLI